MKDDDVPYHEMVFNTSLKAVYTNVPSNLEKEDQLSWKMTSTMRRFSLILFYLINNLREKKMKPSKFFFFKINK